MPLSIITYNEDASLSEIRSIQASDPAAMAAKSKQMFAEFAALNEDIQDDFDKWVPADANIAGAGDGHTFVVTVTWVRNRCLRLVNVLLGIAGGVALENSTLALPLDAFKNEFVMASSAEDVTTLLNQKRKQLVKQGAVPGLGVLVVWQQIAGASTGHRFMGGISALAVAPPA